MRKRTKWILGVVGAALLLLVADEMWVAHRDRVAQLEQDARYSKLIEDVRRQFPIGMSLADATTIIHKRQFPFSEAGKHIYLHLGSDPSRVWYCSRWTTSADLTFDGDVYHESPVFKLQTIGKNVFGDTCL